MWACFQMSSEQATELYDTETGHRIQNYLLNTDDS